MAVQNGTGGNKLVNTGYNPAVPFTIMAWHYATGYTTNICGVAGGVYGTYGVNVGWEDESGTWRPSIWISTGTTYPSGSLSLAANEWHHFALVCRSGSSNNIDGYFDGTLFSTASEAVSLTGGVRAGTSYHSSGSRITCYKLWTAELSADEIRAEMRSIRPVRLTNLQMFNPMLARSGGPPFRDLSGNGRSLSDPNTVTWSEGDGPPVWWGAAPLIVGAAAVDYGTPYDHEGVAPWSSIWRPGRV